MSDNTPTPHPCARCATMQKTCCQRAEILVTDGDLGRIAKHTGHRDFWHRRRPTDPAYFERDPDDPNWLRLAIAPDGTRQVLRRRPGGDCTFLGAKGCVLPTDVRPLVCRLYPFVFNEKRLLGEDPDYCPVKRLAPDGKGMLKVLDMREADGERWRRQLYEELWSDLEAADAAGTAEPTATIRTADRPRPC
ncbi:MAG: YkgJ family cysteine cluster protein [Phycisphaerales bacterium]|nr:YkgJ family cysteine cluster protein [Phycisphaerales bacterium]